MRVSPSSFWSRKYYTFGHDFHFSSLRTAHSSVWGAHLEGKVVLLFFTSSSSLPAKALLPSLENFYDEAREAGKQIEVSFATFVFIQENKSQDMGNDLFFVHTCALRLKKKVQFLLYPLALFECWFMIRNRKEYQLQIIAVSEEGPVAIGWQCVQRFARFDADRAFHKYALTALFSSVRCVRRFGIGTRIRARNWIADASRLNPETECSTLIVGKIDEIWFRNCNAMIFATSSVETLWSFRICTLWEGKTSFFQAALSR